VIRHGEALDGRSRQVLAPDSIGNLRRPAIVHAPRGRPASWFPKVVVRLTFVAALPINQGSQRYAASKTFATVRCAEYKLHVIPCSTLGRKRLAYEGSARAGAAIHPGK